MSLHHTDIISIDNNHLRIDPAFSVAVNEISSFSSLRKKFDLIQFTKQSNTIRIMAFVLLPLLAMRNQKPKQKTANNLYHIAIEKS